MTGAADESVNSRHVGGRLPGSLKLFLGSVAVLLLALGLSGTLTVGALRAVHHEAVAAAVRMVGHEWALRIQGSLRFGKPIEQFYGLEAILAELRYDLDAAALIALTLPDGRIVGAQGPEVDAGLSAAARHEVETAVRDVLANPEVRARKLGERHHFVFPIRARDGSPAGALAVVVEATAIAAGFEAQLRHNLALLALIGAAGSLAILAGLPFLSTWSRNGARRLPAIPIAVLMATQLYYGWEAVPMFRQQYLKSTAETATLAAERLERDFERLFAKGVVIERLAGVDAPFLRIMAEMPEIGFMEIQNCDGAVLQRVYRDGRLERGPAALASDPDHDVVAELDHGPDRTGFLRIRLAEQAIAAGVGQRVLDAGTVMLTSALFVVELFILMSLLVRPRAAPPAGARERADGAAGPHLQARPGAFLLLFAWALPLSFIPLRMREIYQPVLGLPEHVVLALPISAEMLCALVAAMVAGSMTDRRGWHVPFLWGVGICALGSLLSSVAADAWDFIAARAVVGLGYGLAWMGIQGLVFLWTPPCSRARGLANLVAGIFAGHICGGAVGAMLAQQTGYATVFAVSAALMAAPALFASLFMRSCMGRPQGHDGTTEGSGGFDLASVRRLLTDRSFVALLLGSVVPFSVAQVGLLYYVLPVHLSEQGVSQANIGRILMLFGLSVIYLGPLIGRLVDRFERKALFIVVGGLVGGGGMAFLYVDDGVPAVAMAVFLLGLASSLSGSAQSAFALDLPVVRDQGAGKAMGIQRAADKLGQVLGPLLVGMLFATLGAEYGLALTGLYYLAATVAFAMLVRGARTHTMSG